MLFDAGEVAWGRIGCDVVVLGAGPAGMAVAGRAAAAGASVVVLESGGTAPAIDPDLADADVFAREPLHDLVHARPRGIGGSTQIWGGWCLPLDAEDLGPRPSLHDTAWPIDSAAVAKYLPAAREFCGVPDPFHTRGWARASDVQTAVPDLEPTAYPVLGERNLGLQHLGLAEGDGVDLVTQATAVSIEMTPGGRRAASVRVGTGAGERSIVADAVVLAAGSVETARILLASADRDRPAGLGNGGDHVGRYFMDHPQVEVVRFRADRRALDIDYFLETAVADTGPGGRHASAGSLALSPAGARRRDVGRYRLALEPAGDHFRHGLPRTRSGVPHGAAPPRAEPDEVAVIASVEQIPAPGNRVRLGDRTDRYGVPLPRVDWRLTEVDHATIRDATDVGEAVARALGGSAVRRRTPDDGCWDTVGGPHHLGTARMSADERDGVVDEDCRVHGTENVFVAGGAVFPTTGHAPPTLTMVALALRLGDLLASRH